MMFGGPRWKWDFPRGRTGVLQWTVWLSPYVGG